MLTTTLAPQTPLETLVISQLTEIRKRETALQEQWKRFSGTNAETDQRMFVEEVMQLQQRMDRLTRMMDAMGGYLPQIA